MIRDKANEMGTPGTSKSLSLKNTSGPPLRVEVSPKTEPAKGVSVSDLKEWMKREGICLSQMRRNGKYIRKFFGRKSIERHAREALENESHTMDDFFDTQELIFTETVKTEVKGKVKKEKRRFKR